MSTITQQNIVTMLLKWPLLEQFFLIVVSVPLINHFIQPTRNPDDSINHLFKYCFMFTSAKFEECPLPAKSTYYRLRHSLGQHRPEALVNIWAHID